MTVAELKSLEDLHQHTLGLAARDVRDDPVVRRLESAKQIAWLFLLVSAFLLYYLMDKMQQALTMLI